MLSMENEIILRSSLFEENISFQGTKILMRKKHLPLFFKIIVTLTWQLDNFSTLLPTYLFAKKGKRYAVCWYFIG